ncbi:MAG TPA: nitrite reductase small subunit NirD [Steroidobacteraceae bacterium]|nr:nitrite reductase small subunit NirD [Steroidobacteraceae bacterium]
MTQWSRICAVSDIPPLGARVAEVAGIAIAVFRTADDRVFALRDRCPHKGGPLSQGIVHGEQVTCPLHGWVIGLGDGAAEAPDAGCTARYEVQVVDGEVWLDVTPRPAADVPSRSADLTKSGERPQPRSVVSGG